MEFEPAPGYDMVEMDRAQFTELLSGPRETHLLAKFSADWCKNCPAVTARVEKWCREEKPPHIQCLFFDCDDSFDLFASLKQKKIAPAIPCLLFYRRENNNMYAPDEILVGGKELDAFLAKLARTPL